MINIEKQNELIKKYQEITDRMKSGQQDNNKPKYEIAKKELKTIRMTLGILGISIKGIND